MRLAKIALVALALWMPSASFAAAVFSRPEASCPAQDEQGPGESDSDSENEAKEFTFHGRVVPVVALETHHLDDDSHRPLDGHLVEPLLPPPNSAAR